MKILVDLAADPNFELGKLLQTSSRWSLYEDFIFSLYARDVDKIARAPISAERRVSFISEIAYWLWSEKNARPSFSISELPARIIDDMPSDEDQDQIGLFRELLSGSILDKKDNDVYYFGHRSFAEFLVARRILSIPPSHEEHEKYSFVYADGVKEFVLSNQDRIDVTKWLNTLGRPKLNIRVSYFALLASYCGGFERVANSLSDYSPWKDILTSFDKDLTPSFVSIKEVVAGISKKRSMTFTFCWQYLWIMQCPDHVWDEAFPDMSRTSSEFAKRILSGLLTSVFEEIHGASIGQIRKPEFKGLGRLCRAAVSAKEIQGAGRSAMVLDQMKLIDECLIELESEGFFWSDRSFARYSELEVSSFNVVTSFEYSKMERIEAFLLHCNWDQVVGRRRDSSDR